MNNKTKKISLQIKEAMRHIKTKHTVANLAAYIRLKKSIRQIAKIQQAHIILMGGGR